MAASNYELERRGEQRAEVDGRLRSLELDHAALLGRVDRQDARINLAIIVAVIAAVGGTVFGVVNFVLLMQLLSRLS